MLHQSCEAAELGIMRQGGDAKGGDCVSRKDSAPKPHPKPDDISLNSVPGKDSPKPDEHTKTNLDTGSESVDIGGMIITKAPTEINIGSESVNEDKTTVILQTNQVEASRPLSAAESSLEQRLAALEIRVAENSSKSDRVVCKTALSANGDRWEEDPEFKGALDEALRRKLTVDRCREVLGRPSISVK